jgi:hypothetical protein
MKKVMSSLAILSYLFAIVMNYLSSTGYFGGTTVGDISEQYPTLITPAGYTFAIWGLIYIALFAFTIFQARPLYQSVRESSEFSSVRLLFTGSNLINGIWILVWVNDQIALSLVLMIILFLFLLLILVRIPPDLSSLRYKWMGYIPFQIYTGWITVALISNTTIYLKKIGFDEQGLSEPIWAIILLVVAAVIYTLMLIWRKIPAYGFVGSWAAVGIAANQVEASYEVGLTAYIVAGLLFLVSIIRVFR